MVVLESPLVSVSGTVVESLGCLRVVVLELSLVERAIGKDKEAISLCNSVAEMPHKN